MLRAVAHRRGWPVADVPGSLLRYLVVVELAALACAVAALASLRTGTDDWWKSLLLLLLAVGYEEGAGRASRLQWRLVETVTVDMTSVWTVSAAVALQPAQCVLLVAAVLTFAWRRNARQAGTPLHRAMFSGCAAVIACLTANLAGDYVVRHTHDLSSALAGSMSVIVVIVVSTAVGRSLITVAVLGSGGSVDAALGSKEDNFVELATLCLGGLVSLAVLREPWLVVLAILPMVTLQRSVLMRQFETAATFDAKTGLLNAVAWQRVAEREIARSERTGTALAVLILDIDHFKRVNDRHGHLVGDAVLSAVGRCLSSQMREYDTVGRFGGEEFVVVLPSATVDESLVIAERLRSAVRQLRVGTIIGSSNDTDDDRLAISIGVACQGLHGIQVEELLRSADAALYCAKADGRDRVVLAAGGADSTDAAVTGTPVR